MRILAIAGLLFVSVISCALKNEKNNAALIIERSIEVSGGKYFEGATIQFDFRDKQYRSYRKDGLFELQRIQKDTAGNEIKDVLNNKGLLRYINNQLTAIPDSMAAKYTASVNSVHYYAYLPFGLNGAAIIPTHHGMSTIKGKEYHKIKVAFNEEGGGEDFEDIYLFWIDPETFKVDFFAYLYFSEGGGIRFREAYNERYVKGIRFVDYHNYKMPIDQNFYSSDSLFDAGKLEFISDINLENISVTLP